MRRLRRGTRRSPPTKFLPKMLSNSIILLASLIYSQGQCFKSSRQTKTPQQQPSSKQPSGSQEIRWSGNTATLTWFNDGQVQCFKASDMPPGPRFAVNPILLGFTANDFSTRFSNVQPHQIPWCGKHIKLTVNGKSTEGTIVDTCNPANCDYTNVIDLLGTTGRDWLKGAVGDDFYRGNVQWSIT